MKKENCRTIYTFPLSLFRNLDKNKCIDKTPEDSHQISNSLLPLGKGLEGNMRRPGKLSQSILDPLMYLNFVSMYSFDNFERRRKSIKKKELPRESLSNKLPV